MITISTEEAIAGVFVTILLGALGSGLWDIAFKPISMKIPRLTLIIFTFGLKKFRNPIYRRISRGKEDNSPYFYFIIILTLIFTFIYAIDTFLMDTRKQMLSPLDSIVEKYDQKYGTIDKVDFNPSLNLFTNIIGLDSFLKLSNENGKIIVQSFKNASSIKDKYENIKSFEEYSKEDRDNLIGYREEIVKSNDSLKDSLLGIRNKLLSYAIMLFAVGLVSFLYDLIRQAFVNEAVKYFNQIMRICKPYIKQEEYDGFYSRLSQISCRDDFKTIINDLDVIAKKNNISIPCFRYL